MPPITLRGDTTGTPGASTNKLLMELINSPFGQDTLAVLLGSMTNRTHAVAETKGTPGMISNYIGQYGIGGDRGLVSIEGEMKAALERGQLAGSGEAVPVQVRQTLLHEFGHMVSGDDEGIADTFAGVIDALSSAKTYDVASLAEDAVRRANKVRQLKRDRGLKSEAYTRLLTMDHVLVAKNLVERALASGLYKK